MGSTAPPRRSNAPSAALPAPRGYVRAPTATATPAAAAASEDAGGDEPSRVAAPTGPLCPMQSKPVQGLLGGWYACVLLVYMVVCLVASFGDGWYQVSYSANPNIEPCQMPLSDCTLGACREQQRRTGLQTTQGCEMFSMAKACFLLAVAYAMFCLCFFAGLACGHTEKLPFWTKLDFSKTKVVGQPSGECCVDTRIDCGAKCGCCRVGALNNGVVPHGGIICGLPLLMLLGILFVLTQNKDEFEGIPDAQKGYGDMFWWILMFALASIAPCVYFCLAGAEGCKSNRADSSANGSADHPPASTEVAQPAERNLPPARGAPAKLPPKRTKSPPPPPRDGLASVQSYRDRD